MKFPTTPQGSITLNAQGVEKGLLLFQFGRVDDKCEVGTVEELQWPNHREVHN